MTTTKNSTDNEIQGTDIHSELKVKFDKQQISYVLITCQQPKSDGSMNVEMSYGGDPAVAEYLVQSAQFHFEEEE